MDPVLLLGPMAVAVAALLTWDAQPRRALVAKTCASLCFVALGFGCGDLGSAFDRLILLGLVLAALGDVALALSGDTAFRAGVAAFALGHLAYAAATTTYVTPLDIPRYALAPVLLSGAAYAWLYPHLGAMRGAVAVYVVVISVMVCAALALHAHEGGRALRFLVGALLFYASDLSVARDRFVRPAFSNRAWGLPAYYAGQACIALSAGDL